MSKPRATYLFTETRLNLDQAYAGSTIELALPDSANPNVLQPKRKTITSAHSTDETSFSRDNLANDASLVFRREARYPRSFLWRLLDDRKLLELQSVDLTQDAGEKTEALLTLRLRFSNPVRPYCIAFADPDEKDALVVFAITTAGELYTITLHKDAFVHVKSTEALPTDWCKVITPPALRVREPFSLTVVGANELFVSLSDGGLLKLDYESGSWRESYFSAPGWSLVPRAIAKWKGDSFVRFGDTELDSSTAIAVALSPDEENIITICLNHSLRIWNAKTGRITTQADLTEADESKLHQQQNKFLINPNQKQLLQVLDVPGKDGDQYYIATFSPKSHEFSFWAVLDADSGIEDHGVRRVQSDFKFVPPVDDLMETSAWNLEEFYIQAHRGWSKTQLWLRARSGPISRVFVVEFGLFDDEEELQTAWAGGWKAVNAGRQAPEYLNLNVPAEVQEGDANLHYPNVSDQWLDFLFYPGRFTTATLDTALHVYSKGPSPSKMKGVVQKGPLKERISQAVTKKASFSLIGADHDQREIKMSEEWNIFYGLVQDLHKRRATAISFTFDVEDRLPWIISADFISPVRTCKDLDVCDFHRSAERSVPSEEQIAHLLNESYEILDLLHVTHIFRANLPSIFIDNFKRILLPELLSDPSSSVSDRMSALHEQADFSSFVGDEDWNRLHSAMEECGGYDVLDFASFNGILEQLEQEPHGKRNNELITRYGARALIRTAQENLALNTNTLLDLLLLVVFVETEIDQSDLASGMQNPWRGQDLYVAILDRLREQAVLDFLMKNLRTETTKRNRRSSVNDSPTAMRSSISEPAKPPSYTSTLMESLFIGDWATIHVPADMELPDLITYWARRWTSALDLNFQLESFTAHVLADLIKHGEDALASEFLQYVPSTGWSVYLRGRLQLLLGEFDRAATNFKKAACSISLIDIVSVDTADLLRPDERGNFSRGIVGYFEHIMSLYDSLKAFTYVVDFAQEALQHQQMNPPEIPEKKAKKSAPLTLPPTSQLNLLSRLFIAALDSAQYDIAYSTLVRLPNPALRRSSLQQFIEALVRAQQPQRLLSYPFASLSAELDSELAHKARTALSVTAPASLGFHRVLYALRIKHGDFRGAAQCLWEYVARLKGAGEAVLDPRDERLADAYLMVINAMSCCGAEDAWVLDEGAVVGAPDQSVGKTVRFAARSSASAVESRNGAGAKKRRLVWLDDVRKEYQELLDRVSELEEGKYAFVEGDGMEVDVL